MRILDFLPSESIIVSLNSVSKVDVLSELTEPIVLSHPNLDKAELMKTLIERERLGSTGLGGGVAIPHGKCEGLNRLAASFGRSSRGVDFNSMDNKPTYLFFLLLAPKNCAGEHLKALARISRLFKDPLLTNSLKQAESANQVIKLIEEHDLRYP